MEETLNGWLVKTEPNTVDTCGKPVKYAECPHCGFRWNNLYAVRNYFKFCPNCGHDLFTEASNENQN